MADNQLLPFATASGALLTDQVTYSADPRRQNGIAPGIADPAFANKTWRQTSVVASMIGQFIVNVLQQNVIDNGDVAGLLTQFEAALTVFAGAPGPASLVHGGYDSGTANAIQVQALPVIAALRSFMVLIVTPNATSVAASAQNPATLTLTNTGTGSNVTGSVLRLDGTPVRDGDWKVGQFKVFICDGTDWLVEPANTPRTYWGGTDTGTADSMQITTDPTFTTFFDGQIINFIKGPTANATVAPALTANGISPAPVVTRNDGSALVAGDLPANTLLPTEYQAATSTLRLLWPITPRQVRVKLSGDLQLYVRFDGSDSNDGLANTTTRAFKTVQGCWNAIFGLYDPAGFTVYINVGVGVPSATYDSPIFSGYAGRVVLSGDPAAPTNTILGTITVPAGGATLTIQNFMINFPGTGAEPPVEASINCTGNTVTIGNNITFRNTSNKLNLYEVFATGSGAQIIFADGAQITVDGAGSRQAFVTTSNNASMRCAVAGGTVTFKSNGTISYTGAFTEGYSNSTQAWDRANFSQFTATGNRAAADGGAQIVLGGVTLPGNSGPTTATHNAQIY